MIKRFLVTFAAFALFSSMTNAQTLLDSIKVNEYFYGANMYKVALLLKTKYNVPIVPDSAILSPYRVDVILTNTKLRTTLDVILSDHKMLKWFVDSTKRITIAMKSPEEMMALPIAENERRAVKISINNIRCTGRPTKTDVTVSGIIKDSQSGEALPFATVSIKGTQKAAVTNVDGYFTLFKVPTDTSTIAVSYVGYKNFDFYLNPKMNLSAILIPIDQANTQIDEVTVMSQRNNVMQASEGVSEMKMSPLKIGELPSLGDKDIFRTFQLMPGVSAANESSSGLYVRGGTPDQNLILFDGFTVYNQEHLYGMFSAFNANAIKDVTLYKGGFESKYGGRISSVVDIVGKTGNSKTFNAGLDASFLGFNSYVEIPLNGKGSIFLAGRRSYQTALYDKIFNAFSKTSKATQPADAPTGMKPPSGMGMGTEEASPKSYFYDLNGKITYNFTPKDVVSLSAFNGQDDLDNSRTISRAGGGASIGGENTDLSKWGNWGSSLKWSRKWSDRFYSNNLISFSNYYSERNRTNSRTLVRNDTTKTFKDGSLENNQLYDYSFKTENEYKFNQSHQLEFGLHATEYQVKYDYITNDTNSILNMKNTAFLGAAYIQDRLTLAKKLHILPGMRCTYYQLTKKVYLEPRFQTTYDCTSKFKLKGSWGTFYQFANRIIREDISSGSRDVWLLSDDKSIPVSKAIHYIGGASYETGNWLFDAEAYYKDISGLSEYTLRFTPQFGNKTVNYSQLFYKGNGYSRGFDVLAQRKFGKYTGWVGYTYGQTRYKFDVYGQSYFPASHDVTNEFKIVNTYATGRWVFAATWIYTTGRPYTKPVGTFSIIQPDGTTKSYTVTSSKNSARYPDYHRLDISAKYKFLIGDKIKTDIGLSIFNVYNRKNIWYKEYQFDETGLTQTNVTLLGFTPNLSISFQLK
jgi:ferric enterobactin receptor